MTVDPLKEIFAKYVSDIQNPVDIEKLCDLFGVKLSDFFNWLNNDDVRFAKWKEFNETIAKAENK